jgi:hypothetical protein
LGVNLLVVLFVGFIVAIMMVVMFVGFLTLVMIVVLVDFFSLVVFMMFVMFLVFMVFMMFMMFMVFMCFTVVDVVLSIVVFVLLTSDFLLLFVLRLIEHVFLELLDVALDDVFFWQLFFLEPDFLLIFLNLVSPLDLVLQLSELLLDLALNPQSVVPLSQISLLLCFFH